MKDNTELIANQWKDFMKLEAGKAFIEYIEFQNNVAIDTAKGSFSGEEFADYSKLYPILQRSVGYDLIREYIDGFIEYKKLDK